MDFTVLSVHQFQILGLVYVDVDNDEFFLPSVILWNPSVTHPNVVNSWLQTCMMWGGDNFIIMERWFISISIQAT